MKKELVRRAVFDSAVMIVLAVLFAFNYMLFIVKNQIGRAHV